MRGATPGSLEPPEDFQQRGGKPEHRRQEEAFLALRARASYAKAMQ